MNLALYHNNLQNIEHWSQFIIRSFPKKKCFWKELMLGEIDFAKYMK